MKTNFNAALSLVLKHEGGWADHPKDPGGATMKGITIAVYRANIKPNGTKDDLRKITDAQVASIYKKQYWDKVRSEPMMQAGFEALGFSKERVDQFFYDAGQL